MLDYIMKMERPMTPLGRRCRKPAHIVHRNVPHAEGWRRHLV